MTFPLLFINFVEWLPDLGIDKHRASSQHARPGGQILNPAGGFRLRTRVEDALNARHVDCNMFNLAHREGWEGGRTQAPVQ